MNFRRSIQRRYAGSGIDTAPLNWRQGLFRLWLLVSAAWIMGWAIYVILSGLGQEFKTTEDFLAIPVVFFGPPIALLLCGLATGWAIRGFSAEKISGQRITPPPNEDVFQLRQGATDDYVS